MMTPDQQRAATDWLSTLLLASDAVIDVRTERQAPDQLWVGLADGRDIIVSIDSAS